MQIYACVNMVFLLFLKFYEDDDEQHLNNISVKGMIILMSHFSTEKEKVILTFSQCLQKNTSLSTKMSNTNLLNFRIFDLYQPCVEITL